MELTVKLLVESEARGPLVWSNQPLSFWGGYDSHSGEVIDRRHPLSGQSLAGKMLVFPGSRGSSSGSGVLLEAIRNRTAPAALLTLEPDHILSLAALLALELYARTVPVGVVSADFFEWATHHSGENLTLYLDGRFELSIENSPQ
jgi:predicted aconitase with swiveling domain